MDVLVFGGTVEGRLLVEWLSARDSCGIIACTATEYGSSLVAGGRNVRTLQGPLSDQEKWDLLDQHEIACIVDATHPYAQHITDSILRLGRESGTEVVRIVREPSAQGPWISVPDAQSAADHLAAASGNILLTTGSKDLATYTAGITDYQQRLYVRILPQERSLAHAFACGVPANHVIAMQGPFSEQLNCAFIREFAIEHLVTKQSGRAGGFGEKVAAAEACGIELVVIERPREEVGLSLDEAKTVLEERYGL